jgi:hypothetical protein
MKKLMLAAMVTLVGCAGGVARETSSTIGTSGGALTLSSGVELRIPAGALKEATEVHLRETEVAGRRHIELEPAGLRLATTGQLEVRVRAEVELGTLHVREDGASTEVESHRRGEDAARHALEIEVEHLGELEVGDDHGTDTRPDDPATHDAGDDHGGR